MQRRFSAPLLEARTCVPFMVPCGSVRGLAVVHRARCATETLLIGIRRASSESTPQRIVHVMHAAPPRKPLAAQPGPPVGCGRSDSNSDVSAVAQVYVGAARLLLTKSLFRRRVTDLITRVVTLLQSPFTTPNLVGATAIPILLLLSFTCASFAGALFPCSYFCIPAHHSNLHPNSALPQPPSSNPPCFRLPSATSEAPYIHRPSPSLSVLQKRSDEVVDTPHHRFGGARRCSTACVP
jgi:hypothetical protein